LFGCEPSLCEIRPELHDRVALDPRLDIVPPDETLIRLRLTVILVVPTIDREVDSADVGAGLADIIPADHDKLLMMRQESPVPILV
jgi:hypothetical protein